VLYTFHIQRSKRSRLHDIYEELVDRRSWPTRYELEVEVFSYIEGFYNPRRRAIPRSATSVPTPDPPPPHPDGR